MYSRTSGVPFPFDTYDVFNPCARAILKISTAHSLVISGSLYVLVTMRAPCSSDRETNCSGVSRWGGAIALGSRTACDVTQFWQYAQWKSQPSIPKLMASDPGSAWKNGFFSTGSS